MTDRARLDSFTPRALTSKWAVILAGAIVALVVAMRLRPDVLFDDAAITFRYAARIADGSGFTFNDADRTNGASAPFYTLVLAVSAVLGVVPERMAVVLGVSSFASVVAFVGILAQRIAGRIASVLAMGLLVTSTVFQNQALSGMESAFAAALGMGALVALSKRRFAIAGTLLGLALFNRLDALALAAPMLVVAAMVDLKAAKRVGLAALATVCRGSFFHRLFRFAGSVQRYAEAGWKGGVVALRPHLGHEGGNRQGGCRRVSARHGPSHPGFRKGAWREGTTARAAFVVLDRCRGPDRFRLDLHPRRLLLGFRSGSSVSLVHHGGFPGASAWIRRCTRLHAPMGIEGPRQRTVPYPRRSARPCGGRSGSVLKGRRNRLHNPQRRQGF